MLKPSSGIKSEPEDYLPRTSLSSDLRKKTFSPELHYATLDDSSFLAKVGLLENRKIIIFAHETYQLTQPLQAPSTQEGEHEPPRAAEPGHTSREAVFLG